MKNSIIIINHKRLKNSGFLIPLWTKKVCMNSDWIPPSKNTMKSGAIWLFSQPEKLGSWGRQNLCQCKKNSIPLRLSSRRHICPIRSSIICYNIKPSDVYTSHVYIPNFIISWSRKCVPGVQKNPKDYKKIIVVVVDLTQFLWALAVRTYIFISDVPDRVIETRFWSIM